MNHAEKQITFENLRVRYGTSRSYIISGEGRNRVYGNRVGMMTNLGDLEQKEWKRLAQQLIQSSGEEQLQAALLEWTQEKAQWLRGKQEQEQYALELHMSRIFDRPEWVDYIPFNRRYRPEVLKTASLAWIVTPCCQKPGQVTKEQLDRAEHMDHRIFCPYCGRSTDYCICDPEEQPDE